MSAMETSDNKKSYRPLVITALIALIIGELGAVSALLSAIADAVTSAWDWLITERSMMLSPIQILLAFIAAMALVVICWMIAKRRAQKKNEGENA